MTFEKYEPQPGDRVRLFGNPRGRYYTVSQVVGNTVHTQCKCLLAKDLVMRYAPKAGGAK